MLTDDDILDHLDEIIANEESDDEFLNDIDFEHVKETFCSWKKKSSVLPAVQIALRPWLTTQATLVDATLVTSKFRIHDSVRHESPPARECVDFTPTLPRAPDPRFDLRSQLLTFPYFLHPTLSA
ncbi:hypothetical protein QTP88_001031 [Uroleucon formosanum]